MVRGEILAGETAPFDSPVGASLIFEELEKESYKLRILEEFQEKRCRKIRKKIESLILENLKEIIEEIEIIVQQVADGAEIKALNENLEDQIDEILSRLLRLPGNTKFESLKDTIYELIPKIAAFTGRSNSDLRKILEAINTTKESLNRPVMRIKTRDLFLLA